MNAFSFGWILCCSQFFFLFGVSLTLLSLPSPVCIDTGGSRSFFVSMETNQMDIFSSHPIRPHTAINWVGFSFLDNLAFLVSMMPLLWFISCISDFFIISFVLSTPLCDLSVTFLMAWSWELCLHFTCLSLF